MLAHGWHASTPIIYLQLVGITLGGTNVTTRLEKYVLGFKILFGNLTLVSPPAFSSRTKALQRACYSPGYPENGIEMEDVVSNSVDCVEKI